MNRNITIVSLLLLQLSCSTTEKKNVSNTTIIKDSSQKTSENVFETFDKFYKKFYSDSTFQLSRIKFPLSGNNSMYENAENGKMKDFENDTIFIKNNKFFWKKKGWIFLKTLEKQGDFGYKKRIEKKADIMREDIYSDNSEDRVIRDFKQIEGKWVLIYYGSTWY